MNRRRYLTAALAAAAGLSGCITTGQTDPSTTSTNTTTRTTTTTSSTTSTTTNETTTERDLLELPPDRTYSIDDYATYDSVRVKTSHVGWQDSVQYNNPEKGTIETWNPGPGRMIVAVTLWAENLSNDHKEHPHWQNFHLEVPGGTLQPVLDTPDGTSVTEIERTDHIPNITWGQTDGIDANYEMGWSAVFNAPKTNHLAVKWDGANPDPYYWTVE